MERDDYEKAVRGLLPAEEADEMLAAYDRGWFGFPLPSPMSLALAAVSKSHDARLLEAVPELEDEIRAMQRDPASAIASMRARLLGRD